MKTKHITICFIFGLLLLVPAYPALADVGPPEPPSGSNLDPGQELTQVQMVAETVILDVQSIDAVRSSLFTGDTTQAKVTASFTMRNLGLTAETMQVRFPLGNPDGSGDKRGSFPELTDLTVVVDRMPVPTTRITTPNPDLYNSQAPPVPWATFEVTFPPERDVLIDVQFTVKAEGYRPYASFTYILETGAGWKGPIGSADILVRLPYEAGPQPVILGEFATGWSSTTAGGQFVGREIRWHFENLEPAREDNFQVSLVAPYAWQAVLDARQAVAAQPGDGNAWGALAQSYKEVALDHRGGVRQDSGGQELYDLSIQAYEQALALAPQTSKWHSGYAELLFGKFYWENYDWVDHAATDYSLMVRIAQELRTALALDPSNEEAQQLLEEISMDVPEAVSRSDSRYTFLILTATPISSPTPLPSETPIPLPSATPNPSSTAFQPSSSTVEPTRPVTLYAATPAPAPRQTQLPICSAANAALLLVIGLMRAKRCGY
jgi:tetratricopeptide (TPR) repeat protein